MELQLPECSQDITKDFTHAFHCTDSSWLLFLPLRGSKFETESCIVCLCVRAGTGSSLKLRCRQQRSGQYHHRGLKSRYHTGLHQKFDSIVQTSTGIGQALRHPKHPEGMPDVTLHKGYEQVVHCSHLDHSEMETVIALTCPHLSQTFKGESFFSCCSCLLFIFCVFLFSLNENFCWQTLLTS